LFDFNAKSLSFFVIIKLGNQSFVFITISLPKKVYKTHTIIKGFEFFFSHYLTI